MSAVVDTVNLDPARAEETITVAKNILANASEAPWFVSEVFTRSSDGTAGRSMMVFETEEAAQAVVQRAPSMIPAGGPTEVVSLEVFEVVDRR